MHYSEHRYRSANGLSLYYREYGNAGQVIMCLPGLTRNSKDFHDLASRLASKYRVLCLDFRGRGQSDHDPDWRQYHPGNYAKDTWKLLDELGISSTIIIGTSLGGLVAMIMAAQQAERIRAIVLNDIGPEIDPAGFARILSYAGKVTPTNNWDEVARLYEDTYARALPGMSREFWLNYAHNTYSEDDNGVPRPDADPNIGVAARKTVKISAFFRLLRKLGILRRIGGVNIDPWDSFKAVTMPCLVLRGALSDILSADIVKKMKQVKPDLTEAVIPARGHAPMLDEPESLEAIDHFLSGIR